MPETVELILADQIYIAKEQLTPVLRNSAHPVGRFPNPEFYRAQSMRLPTFGKPRVIHCAEDSAKHLALPRGCLEEAQQLLDSLKIKTSLRDERFAGTPFPLKFKGDLRPEQHLAATPWRPRHGRAGRDHRLWKDRPGGLVDRAPRR